jgi:hypothetical protein
LSGNLGSNQKQAKKQTTDSASQKQTLLQRFGTFLKNCRFWKFLKEPKTWLETAALIVVICYTHYAGRTLDEIRQQTFSVRKSADAAESAARTAQDTLIASERPWITVQADIVGPLTFDANGAHLPIRYRLKNIGHSPAVNVWGDQILYMPIDPQRDTNSERSRLCSETEKRSLTMGQAIFPTQDLVGTIVTSAGNEDIRNSTRFIRFLNPAIIVCVAYRSTLDANSWHHTGMIYELFRTDGNGLTFAITPGITVPANRLNLSISSFHGVMAN